MDLTRYEVEGAFGDMRVLLEHVHKDENNKLVVLFHGVHGSASFGEGNKYGSLARILLPMGFDVCMVETSRKIRERDIFGKDRTGWIREAFQGKRYCEDLYDNCNALSFILEKLSYPSLYLWGFSLGGLHSIMIMGNVWKGILSACSLDIPMIDADKVSMLITSGSGDCIRQEARTSLSMPVLSSAPQADLLHEAAGNLRNCRFLSFYGQKDGTFSETACRRLYDLVPLPEEDKSFHVVKGADHSFREVDGKPTIEPLKEMVFIIERFTSTATLEGSRNNQG